MRAVAVTCPRATPFRSCSRSSPSHCESAPGSLMLGLKKRWFTVRSSSVTCGDPMGPAAAPKPVMLRIMWNRVSYDATTSLSIPEGPANAIDDALRRLRIAGHLFDSGRGDTGVRVDEDRSVENVELDPPDNGVTEERRHTIRV